MISIRVFLLGVLMLGSSLTLAQGEGLSSSCKNIFLNKESSSFLKRESPNEKSVQVPHSWSQTKEQFRQIEEFLSEMEGSGAAKQIFKDIPELSNLLGELVHHPDKVIESKQLEVLKKYDQYKSFTKILLATTKTLHVVQKNFIEPLYFVLQGVPATKFVTPAINSQKHPGIFHFASAIEGSTLAPLLQLFRPAPFLSNRIEKIFQQYGEGNNPYLVQILKDFPFLTSFLKVEGQGNKAIKDLNPADVDFLVRQNLFEYLKASREFNNLHPHWHLLRKFIHSSFKSLVLASALLAMNHLWYIFQNSISADEYTKMISYNDDNYVDIFVDINGFSHLAIQMDGMVYSYGVDSMSTVPVITYINENVYKIGEKLKKGESRGLLDSATRQLQVIRLNLDAESKLKLKSDLEKSSYMRYENHTFYNDCATMIARALRRSAEIEVPQALNASPSQMGMYFSLLKTLQAQNKEGSPLVSKVFSVHIDLPEWKIINNVNEAATNILESHLFVRMLPVFETWKAYLNVTIPEEKLQSWRPGVLDEFKEIRRESSIEIYQNSNVLLYSRILEGKQNANNKKIATRNLTRFLSEASQKATHVLSNPTSDLLSTFKAEGELHAIESLSSKYQLSIQPNQ